MAEPIDPAPDDPMIRAGEYALGLLEGEDRSAAAREAMQGGAFADAVRWWQLQFAHLAEDAGEAAPSPAVWEAIKARLDSEADDAGSTAIETDQAENPGGLSGWKLAAALAGTAAAAAALALVVVPRGGVEQSPAPPVEAEPPEQLIAQIRSEDGSLSLATRTEPGSDSLAGRLSGFAPPDPETQSAELWVVPVGGAPVSLGLIPSEGQFEQTLDAQQQTLIQDGASLAVTYEDRDGAPHSAPSSEILLIGPLTQL